MSTEDKQTKEERRAKQPKLLIPGFGGRVMWSPYKHPYSIGMTMEGTTVKMTQKSDGTPVGEIAACLGGGIQVTVKTKYGNVIVGIDPLALFTAVQDAVEQFVETRGNP